MHANRRRLLRLVAVVAIMTVALVPTVAGAAGDYQCDGNHYDATNPDHVLYGGSEQTPVVGEKMQLDLSLRIPLSGTLVVFWDGMYSAGSDGAVILGSAFRDVICGTAGDDTVYGMHGNDRIFGMGSGPYVAPNALAAPPVLESWGDYLFGNMGDDLLVDGQLFALGVGASFIGGGVGNDVIYTGDGANSYARGGRGSDSLVAGGGAAQEIRGGSDDDTVTAGGGASQLVFGNKGNDSVLGGTGAGQVIQGNLGSDELTGGSGANQRLYSGKDDDTLVAGTGANQGLFGGLGNDTLTRLGSGANQVADGGPGNDTLTALATAPNGFFGFGGAGDDTLTGGPMTDCLYGDYATTFTGPPLEEVSLCGTPTVYLTLATAFIDVLATGTDHLYGKSGGDGLYGGPGNDILYGNMPNIVDQMDTIDGFVDWMIGNAGADTAYGDCAAGVEASSDYFYGGTETDTSWRFWPARIFLVEDPRVPCS